MLANYLFVQANHFARDKLKQRAARINVIYYVQPMLATALLVMFAETHIRRWGLLVVGASLTLAAAAVSSTAKRASSLST